MEHFFVYNRFHKFIHFEYLRFRAIGYKIKAEFCSLFLPKLGIAWNRLESLESVSLILAIEANVPNDSEASKRQFQKSKIETITCKCVNKLCAKIGFVWILGELPLLQYSLDHKINVLLLQCAKVLRKSQLNSTGLKWQTDQKKEKRAVEKEDLLEYLPQKHNLHMPSLMN